MLVPLKWLREFVDYDLPDQELADLLSLSGLEVDGIETRHQGLERVVVARITAIEPHPDADRLRLVTVDYGSASQTVVCGAPNVELGMVAPLALEGAVLGEITVKKAKIRGVESRGMLLSERELGFSDDHGGILSLDPALALGTPLAEALGLETAVMEISITPNRGDALSVLGVAREIAALRGLPVKDVEIQAPEEGGPIDAAAKVVIEHPEGCPRYAARLVRGVSLARSPLWMRDRLEACGVRPINNVVDITNYVLMERGQPLHAFDYAQLGGATIIVRQAAEGEKFTTLDGQERTLQQGMLLICDAERPVALAGVMGGLNSEITDATGDVLIESAFFDPNTIRRASKRLGLSTESSYRFERGIDRQGCVQAAKRAAQLMGELAGGKIAPGVIDQYPLPYEPPRLRLSVQRTNRYLGLDLSMEQMMRPLESLGIAVSRLDDDTMEALPPAPRTDLERPVDLTEEVARVHGYDNIPTAMPNAGISARPRPADQALRERARDAMAAQGFDEAINYSFAHPAGVDQLRLADGDARRSMVSLQNPLAEDQSVLRTSLLPGLLGAVRRNLGHRVPDVALFEVGKVFLARRGNPQPLEPARLGAVLCGLAQPVSWWAGEQPVGFAHITGAAVYLCGALGLDDVEMLQPDAPQPYLDHGECVSLVLRGKEIGHAGLVLPKVAAAFEVKRPVYYLEMDMEALVELVPDRRTFRHLPRFPEVLRDVALVVDESVAAGEVLAEARAKGGKRLEDVRLFDVYRGKPLPKGRKSLGLRLAYRDERRTLTEDEVLPDFDRMVASLLETFQAEIRA